MFSTSETLSENGIEFTAVASLDIPEIDTEGFEFGDVTYRLQLNGVIETPPDLEEEGTLAKKIAPQDTAVAVTFSEECADEFPSLHYLAPGNPLLHELIDYILAENDSSERLNKLERPISISSPTVVSAWGRNGTWATVTEKGDIEEVLAVEQLTEWFDEFVSNRKLSS